MLDNTVWSFSRVNAYATCPKMFYLTYIKKISRVNNAFAEWGTFGHELLQRYYTGELEMFELSGEFEERYDDNITMRFPYNAYVDLDERYRKSGQDYFDNFEDDFSDYEVISVEEKISTNIGPYRFIGYIDLVLKDDKGYYVCDHKSKSKFKSKAELRHYLFQLYIYSKFVYEKYGEYPVGLIYNMFRVGDIVNEEFSLDEYNKALNWAETTIDMIYEDDTFEDKILIDYTAKRKDINDYRCNDFFCTELCSPREACLRAG